ncbi:hypothetical protein [Deinococcus sp. UYEF24]
MHHPDSLERVSLSPAVIRALQIDMIAGFRHRAAIGMLFGQVVSGEQVNVYHLEPFSLSHEESYSYRNSYIRGRWEAAVDVAWTLRGFMTVGYVLMYAREVPTPEQMMIDISNLRTLGIELNEFILMTVARKGVDPVDVAAYTYTSRSPLTGWRSLSITHDRLLPEVHTSGRLEELVSDPLPEN